MASVQTNQIIRQLWLPVEGQAQAPFNVYAIVDAARSESIYPEIMGTRLKNVCLHRGKRALELAWVAPYLVLLEADDPFTQWLIETGWGRSRASFVRSEASLNELKLHFRTCLTVFDEKGKTYFFRFYDPRVMRSYLPTCNAEELKTIFGPGENFLVEDEDPSILLHFSHTNEKLKKERIPLI